MLSPTLAVKPQEEPHSFSPSMKIAHFHHMSQRINLTLTGHLSCISNLEREGGYLAFALLKLKELSKPQAEGKQALPHFCPYSSITAVHV